jgi:lipopolysaccharide export system protein LptA
MKLLSRATALGLCALCAMAALRAEDAAPTVIKSDSAEMVSTDTDTTFTFRHNVEVTGTNLKITCDELVVVANRTGDPKATIGKQDKLRSLVATGHVRILQNDREATCEKAEVLPGDDKAILSGNLVVRALDNSFVQTGERGTLYRGERRAVIEGGPGHRPTITLPPLRDLGYGKEPGQATSTDSTSASPSTAPQK